MSYAAAGQDYQSILSTLIEKYGDYLTKYD